MRKSIILLMLVFFIALSPVYAVFNNESYIIKVYKDGVFKGQRTVSTSMSAQEAQGPQGPVLVFVMFATLALMGISSGITIVVFGVIGLVCAIMLNMFNGGSIFGIGSAMVWLLVAAGIIIYKIYNRRVQ